jgi:hypothetical protein
MQADDTSSKNDCTEQALAEVREAFTVCLSDREQDPRQTLMRGVLMLMSNLLSISFRWDSPPALPSLSRVPLFLISCSFSSSSCSALSRHFRWDSRLDLPFLFCLSCSPPVVLLSLSLPLLISASSRLVFLFSTLHVSSSRVHFSLRLTSSHVRTHHGPNLPLSADADYVTTRALHRGKLRPG